MRDRKVGLSLAKGRDAQAESPQPASHGGVGEWADKQKGTGSGGTDLPPADPKLGGLLSQGRSWGRGHCGVLVPRGNTADGWMDGTAGRHTEISYVVPPTPDTFLTSVCRAGLTDEGPSRAKPGDCPLSLLGGVFN